MNLEALYYSQLIKIKATQHKVSCWLTGKFGLVNVSEKSCYHIGGDSAVVLLRNNDY